jgi:agmatinase
MTLFRPPLTFCNLPHGLPGPGCRAAVLGVPYDAGIHPFRVGARQGPAAVREQSGLMRRFHVSQGDFDVLACLNAVDCGDVAVVPGRVEPSFTAIEAAAGAVLDGGAVPVAIGGDGSVSLPLMRAAGKRHPGLAVLHVDAHTDAYAEDAGDVPFNPATQFTHAATEGIIDVARSWHLGTRGFTYVGGVRTRTEGLGFRVVTTEDLFRRGIAQTVAEFRDAAAGRPVYLCWDMDIFDPSVAPGVCTPSWGGLTAREGIDLMRALSGLDIVAIDFNTVSPPQDVGGLAAALCGHMMMEAMLLLSRQFGLAG